MAKGIESRIPDLPYREPARYAYGEGGGIVGETAAGFGQAHVSGSRSRLADNPRGPMGGDTRLLAREGVPVHSHSHSGPAWAIGDLRAIGYPGAEYQPVILPPVGQRRLDCRGTGIAARVARSAESDGAHAV
jgi:hypothetical protein